MRCFTAQWLLVLPSIVSSLDSEELSDGRTISYVRSTELMTFTAAKSWCTDQSGTLPNPISLEENNFLAKLGSTWLQKTIQDLKNSQYTNWVLDEPNGDGQQIQLIVGNRWDIEWGDGGWNDANLEGDSLATCYLAVKGECATCSGDGRYIREWSANHHGRTISYVRSTKKMTYTAAKSWCSEQGGNLPIPYSIEENDFLAEVGSTWLQQTKSDLKDWQFTNWRHAEPNGDGQQIQLIVGYRWGIKWGDGGWNDADLQGDSLATCYLAVKDTCPSMECWYFDSRGYRCTLKDSCVKVTCGSTKMTMSVKQGVFADDSSTVTNSVIDSDDYYNVDCHLSNACATSSFSADGSKLIFASKIQAKGDARTRSVDHNEIGLGNGLNIITSPFDVGVDFSCSYDTTFAVSSETYEVQEISINGAITGDQCGNQCETGDLTNSMTMVAGDTATPTVLGDDVNVATTWSLAIDGASHHYKKCTVTQGATAIDVLKDACVSNTLGASLVSNTDSAKIEMKYKSFLIDGESATTQTVTCDIKICAGDDSCVRNDAVTTCADLTPVQYSYQ